MIQQDYIYKRNNEGANSIFITGMGSQQECASERGTGFEVSLMDRENHKFYEDIFRYGFMEDFSAFLQNAFLLKETVAFYLSCNAVKSARKLIRDHLEKYPPDKYPDSKEAEKMLKIIGPPDVRWEGNNNIPLPETDCGAALEAVKGWVVISDNKVLARGGSLKDIKPFIQGLKSPFLLKKIPEQW